MAPSYNKMDRFLTENIEELSYVADALSGLDYDAIVIRKNPHRSEDKYSMTVNVGMIYETVPIPDELVVHIKKLFEIGVSIVSYNGNSVDFTTWNTMSESRGIKYTRTGSLPEVWAAVEIKQLSKENWYYYVSNFEKARARNPHLFQ